MKLMMVLITAAGMMGCGEQPGIVIGVVAHPAWMHAVQINIPNGRESIQICEFDTDRDPVADNYVTASTTKAGYCHDTGVHAPNSAWEMEHER